MEGSLKIEINDSYETEYELKDIVRVASELVQEYGCECTLVLGKTTPDLGFAGFDK